MKRQTEPFNHDDEKNFSRLFFSALNNRNECAPPFFAGVYDASHV